MAWNELLVDLNKNQAGVDLSLMAPYVDGVLIHAFDANLNDPAHPIYDTEAGNHIQEAANAKIPLVGIEVSLNASMWGSGGWQVSLDTIKSQPRTQNPIYMAIKNFLTPAKTCQFIVLALGASTEFAEWNVGEMQTMISALEAGMKAKEIQPLKIMVATTPDFVKNHCYSTSQKINLFENMFYKTDGSCPYKVMVQEQSRTSGTYTWANLKANPPILEVKASAYLGAYPNPWCWQWCLGGIYLPFKGTASAQFGISSFWQSKALTYAWAGITDTTPPPPANTSGSTTSGSTTTTAGTIDLSGINTKLDTIIADLAGLAWLKK